MQNRGIGRMVFETQYKMMHKPRLVQVGELYKRQVDTLPTTRYNHIRNDAEEFRKTVLTAQYISAGIVQLQAYTLTYGQAS